jgi:prepilin signal peptidase PulO-like enzyme (type II secretory pathway)
MRRETDLHGIGFWIRPMLIEIGTGISLAALYWWEVGELGLLLPPLGDAPPLGAFLHSDAQAIAHSQFASHALLLMLMLVASFIDIDEKIIPDTITVPGTLAGLFLAAVAPWSLLTGDAWTLEPPAYEFLTITSPNPWPNVLWGRQIVSLTIALVCWWGWCFAIMPRRWMTRRGLWTAFKVLCARLRREPLTWWIAGLGLAGSAAIVGAWQFAAQSAWAALLTSLAGMAVGGGWIWMVRVICTRVLGREAMGFGDVTLMAMIGSFIGWQASLIAFFIAPFAGVLVAIVQWMLHRDREIYFGPFLCLGSAFVVVAWADVWQSAMAYFEPGWLVPGVILFCLVLMGLMLGAWQGLLGYFERSQ